MGPSPGSRGPPPGSGPAERGGTPVIATVDCFHVRLPAKATFMLVGGAFARPGAPSPGVFVRVRSADGRGGLGRGHPLSHLDVRDRREHRLGPPAVSCAGRGGALRVGSGRHHHAMDRAIAPGWSKGQPLAKAAVDVAVHDLLGRHLGVPIHRLLGGRRVAEITLAHLVTSDRPEEAGAIARAGLEAGCTAFKVKVGIHGLAGDLAMVRAVREAIGPSRFLWVDANQGYSPDEALRQARALQELGVAVFEQPVPADAIGGLQRLVGSCPLPVALDESLRDPAQLYELARLGAVGGAILKVQRSGGLWPGRAMVAVAEAARVPLLGSGLCETDLGLTASLHLFAAAGVAVPVDLNGRQFVESPFASGLEVGPGGRARVPDGPGLGIAVDGAWIEAHGSDPA